MRADDRFLLDTGPIIEYLAHSYREHTRQSWLAAEIQFHSLRTSRDQLAFGRFLERGRGRLWISWGVLTEINVFTLRAEARWLRITRFDTRQGFWDLALRSFNEFVVSGQAVDDRSAEREQTEGLSHVDAGLIALSKKAWKQGQRPVVLTNEGELQKRCQHENIEAPRIEEFLREFVDGL